MLDNQQYGKLKDIGEVRLKQMINKLLLDGCLMQTNDKYGLLRIGPAGRDLLSGEHTVIMKLPKEDVHAVKEQDSGTKRKQKRRTDILNSKGLQLFEELRGIRTKLAKEEGMPPYIIFSDKSLTDMCVKVPMNREEMLEVSGVGEHKYQKYGQIFLDAIAGFTDGKKEIYYYEEEMHA